VVCDVFAAGEKPIDGVSSEALVKAIQEAGHKDVTYVARREDVAPWLAEQAKGGDLLITLGAGNIQLSCNEVIDLLEKTRGPATKKNPVRI
jgi:UDP-N-acetylmuramate--alanine ligase